MNLFYQIIAFASLFIIVQIALFGNLWIKKQLKRLDDNMNKVKETDHKLTQLEEDYPDADTFTQWNELTERAAKIVKKDLRLIVSKNVVFLAQVVLVIIAAMLLYAIIGIVF